MKIIALYTCFNRREKTLTSIKSLYDSLDFYNNHNVESIDLEVYLTDDGCTDGTAESVKSTFPDKDIHILKGDGNLYWAGGMRLCWKEAIKNNHNNSCDYYLLVNDDTILQQNCFSELFSAESYCRKYHSQEGLISGITCSSLDDKEITYGGDVIVNRLTGKSKRMGICATPQMVDIVNANILLVPNHVVDEIGIFYEGYKHSGADNDYSMMAREHGIPVLVTSNVCGVCDNDHHDADVDSRRIIGMTLSERKKYFYHPLHTINDYLTFVKRHMIMRYPLSWLFCLMRIYIPKLYYRFNRIR